MMGGVTSAAVVTAMEEVTGRLYQGVMNIFSETGALLAVASQTGIRPRALS